MTAGSAPPIPRPWPRPAATTATRWRAAGWCSCRGNCRSRPTATKLNEAPFAEQAQQVLDNVAQALAGAGTSIDKLVQVRVYVTDIASWPEFNAIYAQWAGAARPARAVVPVPQLHYGFKIEVEAVALA